MIQQVYLTNSCPLINGEAVFGARNLLSSINGEKFYNDKVICSTQGYSYKTKQDKEANPYDIDGLVIQTYPNPVNNILNIKLSKKIKGEIDIELNDLLGRSILFDKKPELYITEIDMKNVRQGFYILTIKNNEEYLLNLKVYVQK